MLFLPLKIGESTIGSKMSSLKVMLDPQKEKERKMNPRAQTHKKLRQLLAEYLTSVEGRFLI